MAIYHLSVKPISRSAGRSATAAAAYRAGCQITDERTGEIHDFTRKGGVESADIVLPDGAPEWATNRAKLWNAAELAERRKDACVAREFEVALPCELSPAERRRLALDFAKEMANLEGCAVDVAIHAPGREGDNRNHHAHILRTTRKVGPEGLTEKLDTEKAGRSRRDDLDAVRARWAELCNERLKENGLTAQVDHRSLEAQGIDRLPSSHLGPAVSSMDRRGVDTRVQKLIAEQAAAALKLTQEISATIKSIADVSVELEKRKCEQITQPVLKKENPVPAKVPAIDKLPIEQQQRVFDLTREKLAAARQAKAQRVAAKAWERYQRRVKAEDKLRSDIPGKPTGMLAAFKKKAYDDALAVWEKAWSQARRLQEQANKLYSRLAEAAQQHKALGWAYDRIRAKDPALVQRLEDHRKAERQRNLTTELQERQAKKAREKEIGKSR